MSNEAIRPILDAVRAGRDPDTKELHITLEEAEAEINNLVQSAIKDYIKPHLDSCQEENGVRICKNCGLEEPNK